MEDIKFADLGLQCQTNLIELSPPPRIITFPQKRHTIDGREQFCRPVASGMPN